MSGSDFAQLFEGWPYAAWSIGVASTFYVATAFSISHLHKDKRAALSLWLEGEYQSGWATQFCDMFDALFGKTHYAPRCIALSALFSIAAVLLLWLLFDPILGIITLRADTGLTLTQALLLGAAINILPDYLSLYETRWLLKQFERVRNPLYQLGFLLLDAALTGLIIYLGIQGYLWLTGAPALSIIEMMALFSIYSVFFYSTFATSAWAWAYCLSSWLSRLSASLRTWLDVGEAPGKILALLGAGVVLLGSFALYPILSVDERGRTAFDDALCTAFPRQACLHVARLTADQEAKLTLLERACDGRDMVQCSGDAFDLYEIEPREAVELWNISCIGGRPRGCTNLGIMYRRGLGVAQDDEEAVRHYKKGCDGGHALGCTNLGFMYRNGFGVPQDYKEAVRHYEKGCDGGHAHGCSNLGVMYQSALGVAQDYTEAVRLYRLGCDGGFEHGCSNLGSMYQNAFGVQQDYEEAVRLYKLACDGGNARGCTNLGVMYRRALGVQQSNSEALRLYKQGCDGGNPRGCSNLGFMYRNGFGVARDYSEAVRLYGQGCEMGDSWGCEQLERFEDQ